MMRHYRAHYSPPNNSMPAKHLGALGFTASKAAQNDSSQLNQAALCMSDIKLFPQTWRY